MATIKDIAKKMNLGVSTVSMALSGNERINVETRKKILKVAKEMGYVKNGLAADLQKGGRSNLILVVVEDASRPFFARFLDIVQRRVAEWGYDLLISTTFHNHTSTAKRYISEHRGAGALVFTNKLEDEFLELYANEDFPIYVLGRQVACTEYFLSDIQPLEYIGDINVKYLAKQGFTKIAFVRTVLNTLGTVRKFEGYLQGLKASNIEYREDLVFDVYKSNFDSGYEITKELIDKVKNKEIEAVYYADDEVAIGGLHCFLDSGMRVPDDVSIIGHGNLPASKMTIPQLTTCFNSDMECDYLYAIDKMVSLLRKEDTHKIDEYYQNRINNSKETIIERGTVLKKKGE